MPLYCTATFVMNITVKFWAEHIGKEKRKCRVWVGGGGGGSMPGWRRA